MSDAMMDQASAAERRDAPVKAFFCRAKELLKHVNDRLERPWFHKTVNAAILLGAIGVAGGAACIIDDAINGQPRANASVESARKEREDRESREWIQSGLLTPRTPAPSTPRVS